MPGFPFGAGAACYVIGLALCAVALVCFSSPDASGLNTNGIYRISRNPMYMAYFACFLGIALLAKSPLLFIMVMAFQISAHWIILAEERWCLARFGERYEQYMREVRRYV